MANQHIEDMHQENLIYWTRFVKVKLADCSVVPLSDVIYAVPNGGKRNKAEAGRLKKQGVKSGVSDLNLIVPSKGFGSLYIEMKKPKVKGKPDPTVQESQTAWINISKICNHQAVVAYGADEAKTAIRDYLGDLLLDTRAKLFPKNLDHH